jgi:hypothetical protein
MNRLASAAEADVPSVFLIQARLDPPILVVDDESVSCICGEFWEGGLGVVSPGSFLPMVVRMTFLLYAALVVRTVGTAGFSPQLRSGRDDKPFAKNAKDGADLLI